MYQPQVPLIASSPEFRTARLAQIELGSLVLLRDAAGIGVRADALSAHGDLTEGVLRLSPGMVRFERCALDAVLVAMGISYLVEADLTSIAARAPESGDLIIAPNRSPAGLCVTGLFGDTPGLLDLASAIIRPYGAARTSLQVACRWKLVEREQRTRVLLAHEEEDAQPVPSAPARRTYGEDSD
jgi:hypothetical protein